MLLSRTWRSVSYARLFCGTQSLLNGNDILPLPVGFSSRMHDTVTNELPQAPVCSLAVPSLTFEGEQE